MKILLYSWRRRLPTRAVLCQRAPLGYALGAEVRRTPDVSAVGPAACTFPQGMCNAP